MAIQTIKLKNQTLTLPKEWRGNEIFIRRYNNTIVIKKVEKLEFWQSWQKIKPFTKNISQRDIKKAVNRVRKSSKQ